MRSRAAFTLMELLVVISIISLLAALMLPAIGIIKFSVIGTKCLNNQRQIVGGILAYSNDFDGDLPYVAGMLEYQAGKQANLRSYSCAKSVQGQIFPYTQTMAMARCPADQKGRTGAGADDPLWGAHTPDCPSPETCKGRSYSYAPQVLFTATTGLKLSLFKSSMNASLTNGYSRFTGNNSAGVRDTSWSWANIWGTTIVAENWYDNHLNWNGSKCGMALASIDGSARWRTYRSDVYLVDPRPQLTRYEEP